MISKMEFDLDVMLTDPKLFTEQMIRRCVRPAMEQGMRVIAEQALENVAQHDSELTGTRDWWTDKEHEKNTRRPKLRDSIVIGVIIDKAQMLVRGTIEVLEDARYIGRFLEYGHKKFIYGRDTGEFVEPKPWLRPAFDSRRDQAESVFASELRKCINRRRKRSGILKVVTIGVVAGGVVYSKGVSGGSTAFPDEIFAGYGGGGARVDVPAYTPSPTETYWVAA